MGGFECSTHRLRSGRRLDLIASTGHDQHATADYARLKESALLTARDGIRWHLIERAPGQYDFSSALNLLHAARRSGVQVIWDLCHYGWPDWLDIFSPGFVDSLARLAASFTRLLVDETGEVPFICPINEISFFAWASGDEALFYPYARGRGNELKRQLVRAAIAATASVWDVCPQARIIHTDPAINVIADPLKPRDANAAESYRLAQYAGWDMLGGRLAPELGGAEKYLDIIGINYYPHNQWIYPERTMIPLSDPLYRPLRSILREVHERYGRMMFIAETGIEGEARPGWLRYVCYEVCAAIREGVPIEGICLYPAVNHPGWEDDRHCHNGLWDYAGTDGQREIFEPLASELRRQQRFFAGLRSEKGQHAKGARLEPSGRSSVTAP